MLKKIFLSFAISFFAFAPFANHANAATGVTQLKDNLSGFGRNTGLGESDDLKTKIADIINIVLGFLGLLATIVIIYAGFKWITAGGNEEQVTQAKGTLRNSVIGIAVVFLSFVIVNFAVSQLSETTGAGGGGGGGGSIQGDLGMCLYQGKTIGFCNEKTKQNVTRNECTNKDGCTGRQGWVINQQCSCDNGAIIENIPEDVDQETCEITEGCIVSEGGRK